MITGTATLIVDIGNSQNRIVTKFGKKSSDVVVLPNSFAELPEGYVIPEGYLEDDFDNGNDSYVFTNTSSDTRYASGYLAQREFTALIKPTAHITKYNSFSTNLSMQVALFSGYIQLSRMLGAPISDLDVDWNISVLLPAVDFDNRAEMEARIQGITSILFELPMSVSKTIKYNKITVVPESFAAFFAVIFDNNPKLKIRQGFNKFMDETIMVLDIGAGTTDITIVQNFRMIDETRDTIRQGGNNVAGIVRKKLRSEGITLNESEVEFGVIQGKVRDGSREIDIRDKVSQAKKQVAQHIVSELRDIFEAMNFNPRSISYLLTIGGGSLGGETEPISTYLVEYLKEMSPNISNMGVPKDLNARLLNVVGASIMSSQG